MDTQPYPVIRSKVDRAAESYEQNRAANLAQLQRLHEALAKANEGGGDKYNQRHVQAGN